MRRSILLLSLAFVILGPLHGAAFLAIPGIPGESTDVRFKDTITVVDFQHTVSRNAAGIVTANFSITKNIDKASPALAKATSTGAVLTPITLSVRKDGGREPAFYIVILENATVASFDQISQAGMIMESVSFTATKITYSYFPQQADGSLGDAVSETATLAKRAP